MDLRRTGRARTQRLSAVVHPTDSQNLSAFDSEISMRRLRLRLVRRMSFVERKSNAKVLHSPHTERAGPRWDSNGFRGNLTHNLMFSCISYHCQLGCLSFSLNPLYKPSYVKIFFAWRNFWCWIKFTILIITAAKIEWLNIPPLPLLPMRLPKHPSSFKRNCKRSNLVSPMYVLIIVELIQGHCLSAMG